MLHKGRRAAGAAAGGLTEFAYVTNSTGLTSTTSTHTVSFGTADTNRHIIVAQSNGNGRTVSSLTIGGVTATELVAFGSSNQRVRIWIAAVPTGTSGDVVITHSGSPLYSNVSIYRMVHSNYTGALDTAGADHSSGVVDLPIDTVAGGALVAVTQSNNGGTATWANATEDVDVDAGTNDYFSTASDPSTGLATNLALSMTSSDTTPNLLPGCAASFS